jgi:hypothetical protein
MIDVTKDGFLVREIVPGLDFDALQACSAARLLRAFLGSY